MPPSNVLSHLMPMFKDPFKSGVRSSNSGIKTPVCLSKIVKGSYCVIQMRAL